MKVQCPQCREIVEMVEFSTSEEGLGFTCGNCNESIFLANPKARAPEKAGMETAPRPGPDKVVCPKCEHIQKDKYACHRCGLVFEKFDRSLLPDDPEEAVSFWKQIQLLPSDESLHQAFLDACVKADRLDYANRQYRQLAREPGRKELAGKMLEHLLARAQAQLLPDSIASESRRLETKRKSKVLIWITLAVFLALFLYFFLTMTDALERMSP